MRFPRAATATIKMWHVATGYTKEGGKAGTLSVPVVAGLGSELLFMVSYTFQRHVIYLNHVLLVRVAESAETGPSV